MSCSYFPALFLVLSCATATAYAAGTEAGAGVAVAPSTIKPLDASEIMTINQCRAIAEAEEIYHRSDYDGNGILEYAQVLEGRAEDFKRVPDAPLKPVQTTAEEQAQIEKLIQALDADVFATRDKATQDLIALGMKAYARVTQVAAESTELEVAQRCQRAAEHISANNAPAAPVKLKYQFGLLGSNGNGELALIDRRVAMAECAAGCDPAQSSPRSGYLFRVLTRQGDAAPGGKKDYIVNGCMTLGYAILAFPAHYGKPGKRCFMIDSTGIVYGRDFGSKEATDKFAKSCLEYDPTKEWEPVK